MYIAMATEKHNKKHKISYLFTKYIFGTVCRRTYCNLPNAKCKTMKVATKLMKIVLNEPIGNKSRY